MRVLIACEFSGIVRDAFAARGHDAWSCDLLPSETPGKHILAEHDLQLCDILYDGRRKWDLVVAHPPCTFLANSGVRWLYGDDKTMTGKASMERWQNMLSAVKFFNMILNCPASKLCVENPIMHKHARERIAWPYSQIIQPWQFGHGETKATCLWLRGLPDLKPTKIASGRIARVHHESPGVNRWKNRSRTLSGIADAMAAQWGNL